MQRYVECGARFVAHVTDEPRAVTFRVAGVAMPLRSKFGIVRPINISRLRKASQPMHDAFAGGCFQMRAFSVMAITLALVMLVGGAIVCCTWLIIEGSLPIPLASAAMASLAAAVLFLELQEKRQAH